MPALREGAAALPIGMVPASLGPGLLLPLPASGVPASPGPGLLLPPRSSASYSAFADGLDRSRDSLPCRGGWMDGKCTLSLCAAAAGALAAVDIAAVPCADDPPMASELAELLSPISGTAAAGGSIGGLSAVATVAASAALCAGSSISPPGC